MTKIIRTEPNKILAKAVEFHGFVYLQGCTPRATRPRTSRDRRPRYLLRSIRSLKPMARIKPASCKPKFGLRTYGIEMP